MIIQCQACSTKFRVGDEKVKPPGIKVRCSKCGEVFFYEYNLDDDKPSLEADQQSNNVPEPTPDIPEEKVVEETPETVEEQPVAHVETEQEPVLHAVKEEEPVIDQPDTVVTTQVDESTSYEIEEITSASLEDIETVSHESNGQDDELAQLSKEIMAAQIGTDIDQATVEEPQNNSLNNVEIDNLDDITMDTASVEEPLQEIVQENNQQQAEEKEEVPPPAENTAGQPQDPADYRTTNLTVDQDVLEQTYSKGTVATDVASGSYNIKGSTTTRPRRYSKRSKGGGFFRGFFKLFFTVVFLGALFFSSMYVLNEMKIYENDYYSKFNAIAGKYIGKDEKVDLKNVRIVEDTGKWVNSKFGQVYVVSGELVNRSEEPINYVKLKVSYSSDGDVIFSQDVFAGNTLSNWEIKNKPFNAIQSKLYRKKGDILYDDVNNLDGLNFDIQPGDKVPFYSIFPAQDKILGLKYRVRVIDFESSKLSKNP